MSGTVILKKIDLAELVQVFEDSMEWWAPYGEYYGPGQPNTYRNLVVRFFNALDEPTPARLLKKADDA
jgi:hypothetical protein